MNTLTNTVIPVRDNDELSPDLYADIEEGRKEYAAGKCVECRNHEELSSFLESLWHISAHDRIIYDVYDDKLVVLVIKLEGHYDDK